MGLKDAAAMNEKLNGRLLKPLVKNTYLFYTLKSGYVQKFCDDVAIGTAQRTVGIKMLLQATGAGAPEPPPPLRAIPEPPPPLRAIPKPPTQGVRGAQLPVVCKETTP